MLTPASKKEWEDWLVEAKYKPIINIENHDTIGMLVLDADGNLSGACTTSGLAYKMRGRVGDSPLIGAGLFVDNEIGAATATGLGEKVVKTLGSFRVVEYMRQGHNPEDACRLTVEYIKSKSPDYKEFQIGFVAMDKSGRYGGFGLQPGFGYAFNNSDENQYFEAGSLL
jgi:isoaspartyl peptidase/L-asparaginase-like protein (Ntn-hydrolase superfamily)